MLEGIQTSSDPTVGRADRFNLSNEKAALLHSEHIFDATMMLGSR